MGLETAHVGQIIGLGSKLGLAMLYYCNHITLSVNVSTNLAHIAYIYEYKLISLLCIHVNIIVILVTKCLQYYINTDVVIIGVYISMFIMVHTTNVVTYNP